MSKIDILREYVSSLKLDVIGVAETFLKKDVLDAEISIEGFKLFRKDRCQIKEGIGGGVILYVRNEIVSHESMELNKYKAEATWIKIKTDRNIDLTIGVCYKSQVADHNEIKELFDVIEMASRGPLLIMGDFNYPHINWDNFESDANGSEFRDLVLDNYLHQHVKLPTRDKNILDLILTSDVSMVENIEIIEHLGNSDHNIVTWKLINNIEIIRNNSPVRLYHKANFDAMRTWFRSKDWLNEFGDMNIDEVWNKFCEIVNLAVKKFVPLGYNKSKKFPKWMNKSAKVARHYKSRMWIRYRESQANDKSQVYNNYCEYKRAQNKAVKEYKKSKRQFEKRLARDMKNNPKSFYAYIRSKTKVKEVIGPLKDADGHCVSNNESISNILNDYFGSVFTTENDFDEMPEVKQKFMESDNRMLREVIFSRKTVEDKLRKLKINKAPGVDGIVPRILIENANILSEPLYYIYKQTLDCGKVPKGWKLANVTAIFKKGDKSLANNYRPVSLTSHVCKVLETILKESIVEHLNKYNLINDSQHGFTRKRSCLTNLLEFLEFVTDYVDQGFPIDVVYLDFQKAFDKVPHKRLMKKVGSLGITGKIYDWIKDWLNDREQRVVLLGHSSKWIDVKSGVPQGSVLGPLLFLIYINDIDECVNSKLLKFADDTKIFRVVTNPEEVKMLQNDLINLCNWSKDWLMLFNVDKCKVMHFGYNNKKNNYVMDGNILEEVDIERDLGIITQSNLKWNEQCANAVKSANMTLGMIKRSFSYLDKDMVLQLYTSLVRPKLEYSIQAWRPYLKKDIELIEKVQRRATKLVPLLKGKPYEERLKELNLTTLETRRLRGDLIEMFKILKGYDNIDSSKFFELNNTHTRGHSLKVYKPRCHLDSRKFAFSHRVVNVWNNLDDNIIACDSINGFKNRIDKYLKGRGFI